MSHLLANLHPLHSKLRTLYRDASSASVASAALGAMVARQTAIADSLVGLRGEFEMLLINGNLGKTRESRVGVAREFWNVMQLAEKTKVLIESKVGVGVESEGAGGSDSGSAVDGDGVASGSEIASDSEAVSGGEVEQ